MMLTVYQILFWEPRNIKNSNYKCWVATCRGFMCVCVVCICIFCVYLVDVCTYIYMTIYVYRYAYMCVHTYINFGSYKYAEELK